MTIDPQARILIVKLDHIGDMIITTPAFKAIKQRYPACFLGVVANPKSAIVLRDNPYVDQVYVYASPAFDREKTLSSADHAANIRCICKLRADAYDLCIGLREDLANIPLQKSLGIARNISFHTHTRFAQLLDESVENRDKSHAAEILFDLLGLIDIPVPEQITPALYCSESDFAWADVFLAEQGILPDARLIAVSPGGGWFLNWWPAENFAYLCRKILDAYPDSSVVLVGGPTEQEVGGKILEQAGSSRIKSAIAKTTLHQLSALFSRCALTVANDGGPMHVATTAGKPLIALFGPSPYGRFGPLGEHSMVISKDFDCSPCPQFVKGQPPKCTDNRCMQAITVDEVFSAVQTILSKG